MPAQINAVISIYFLDKILNREIVPLNYGANLNSFNCEMLKGGAFRLRACFIDENGNPKRASDYVLFSHGFFSLADPQNIHRMGNAGILGYRCTFTPKKNLRNRTFWEARCASGSSIIENLNEERRLRVSYIKPEGQEVVILSAVEGQYIFIE